MEKFNYTTVNLPLFPVEKMKSENFLENKLNNQL
jgi:hypothetical protein